ncbi:helix-turn-helix domain-containing protein [Paracoccus sp. 11-3]|uniref:Helix-turn-helix domain-containing protein n=1 Tax=Paracoccus amoyensis TaxID=2760093 RepID=A0A926GCQ0_9RHOB|nr:helix-turn-helix domain-containing protein [Paracoccus amoyensis]MBC9246705.1 helix-turn-helix domain-containing protein [Paracoccus amoyensis]
MTKRKPVMDWPAVVAEMHRRGMTMTELAKRNDLPVGSCRRVKGQTHYKAQQLIADFIGQKPEDLWPDRYPQKKSRILDTVKYPPVSSQKSDEGTDSRKVA